MARNKGFRFEEALRAGSGIANKLAPVIGNIAQREFEENFERQGFMNDTLRRWKEVKRRTPGTKAFKYATPAGRMSPILRGKGSGVLAKSIRVMRADSTSIFLATTGKANNYAKYHNDGASNLPQRQFMGDSKRLTMLILKRIDKEVMKALSMV